jgi:hypothetical protein
MMKFIKRHYVVSWFVTNLIKRHEILGLISNRSVTKK